ncbi:hypothetical protein ACVWZV_001711 [Bradyrhizobium sp. GM5.1]
MLLVAHWMRPSWPAIRSVRIQGRFDGRLARSTSQLLLMPPAEARMKASDFRMVSTDEITSRCASALCFATGGEFGCGLCDLPCARVFQRSDAFEHQRRHQNHREQRKPRPDSENLLEFRSFAVETDV